MFPYTIEDSMSSPQTTFIGQASSIDWLAEKELGYLERQNPSKEPRCPANKVNTIGASIGNGTGHRRRVALLLTGKRLSRCGLQDRQSTSSAAPDILISVACLGGSWEILIRYRL